MKTPKKINDKFICEECNAQYINLQALSKHIKLKHNINTYYDKWLKEKGEGLCKICGKKTKRNDKFASGYKTCCSKECNNKYNLLRTKEEIFKIYGVENPYQAKTVKDKIKETNKERYGVEFITQNKEIELRANKKRKKTNKERYGSENILNNTEKREETCMQKYGVKNPVQNKEIWDKIKQTNKERYGVEFPNQNREIFDKGFKIRIQTKQYKNTTLTYQGSYELDFLEKYYDKIDIENGPSIKYQFAEKDKIYHADFFIPSLNLVVEIKNSYLYKKYYEHITAKEKGAISNGYNYIIIVDKHYKLFNQLWNNKQKWNRIKT